MGFNGTIAEDNSEIRKLNNEILELKSILLSGKAKGLSSEKYILDFENFELDILFSSNRKKAKILVIDEVISIQIKDNIVRINTDGIVI